MVRLSPIRLHILMRETYQNARRFDPCSWSCFQVQIEVIRSKQPESISSKKLEFLI